MSLDLVACPNCGGCGYVYLAVCCAQCQARPEECLCGACKTDCEGCLGQGCVPVELDSEPELTPEEEADLDREIEEASARQYAELEAFFRTQGIDDD